MTERNFNIIPPKLRPFVYSGLTLAGLAAAACGGAAKGEEATPGRTAETSSTRVEATPTVAPRETTIVPPRPETLTPVQIKPIVDEALNKVPRTGQNVQLISSVQKDTQHAVDTYGDPKAFMSMYNALGAAGRGIGNLQCLNPGVDLATAFWAMEDFLAAESNRADLDSHFKLSASGAIRDSFYPFFPANPNAICKIPRPASK